jgi:hypothetical protein
VVALSSLSGKHFQLGIVIAEGACFRGPCCWAKRPCLLGREKHGTGCYFFFAFFAPDLADDLVFAFFLPLLAELALAIVNSFLEKCCASITACWSYHKE